jgi:arylsulfatase A-like enzyme
VNRRKFLQVASATALLPSQPAKADPALPNIIFIYADDLGFGDLGCYGSKIPTPNLDKLATEGVLFREFFSASAVCSPARASLMTGRYGVRAGVPDVLYPSSTTGLSLTETTLPQVLKQAGYGTMCIGKWHLGVQDRFLPTRRGFDEFYGLLGSNDQGPVLMHNTDAIESPVELETLTARYTQQAIQYIQRSANQPFFLYMPHLAPHVPIVASLAFKGKSGLGPYGDVVMELDWSVGQILKELEASGLDQNTLVIFSSDNGPWFQGSAGNLRGRKGDTFDGGMREPFIARLPGRIPAGRVVEGFASSLDILPTLAALTAAPLPGNPLDGVNIWPMMTGEAESVDRPVFLYFDSWNIQCARIGHWKLHMARYNTPAYTAAPVGGRVNLRLLNLELYDIDEDPSEGYDISDEHPDVVAKIQAQVRQQLLTMPTAVRQAWDDTQRRRVQPNGSGEWPIPEP